MLGMQRFLIFIAQHHLGGAIWRAQLLLPAFAGVLHGRNGKDAAPVLSPRSTMR